MPRQWDRAELRASRGTAGESARLSRYAARLLAATATATAMTAFVATGTSTALVDPARRAAAAEGEAAATTPGAGGDGSRSAPAGPGRPVPAAPEVPVPGVPSPGVPALAAPGGPSAPQPSSGGGARRPTATPAPVAGGPTPGPAVEVVELTDDDAGLPLFDDGPLAPGDVRTRCITVVRRGGDGPADVRMRVLGEGPLAAWLRVRVVTGTPAARDCTGFAPDREVAQGTLADLAADGDGSLAARVDADEPFGVLVEVGLADTAPPAAQGTQARGGFVWSTSG